jgi:hypothetical protein
MVGQESNTLTRGSGGKPDDLPVFRRREGGMPKQPFIVHVNCSLYTVNCSLIHPFVKKNSGKIEKTPFVG